MVQGGYRWEPAPQSIYQQPLLSGRMPYPYPSYPSLPSFFLLFLPLLPRPLIPYPPIYYPAQSTLFLLIS